LLGQPLTARRDVLEAFHAREREPALLLSPYTEARTAAENWLGQTGASLDGVVAKRRDGVYEPGERAMLKIKCMRTADCVVGGFRYASKGGVVGSLLLGLFDEAGALHHVGFTSAIPGDKAELTKRLETMIEAPGFTGDAPGGPSRWANARSEEWQPLRHELIAEVRYDHVTGRRFRHGTRFLRWRPDKAPEQCRFDQLQAESRPDEIAAALGGGR
jgi:ATP-dependent DNA ligase